jgi:hypothetical protein
MAATVRMSSVGPYNIIILYIKGFFEVSNVISDRIYLTVQNSDMKCSTSPLIPTVSVKIFTMRAATVSYIIHCTFCCIIFFG